MGGTREETHSRWRSWKGAGPLSEALSSLSLFMSIGYMVPGSSFTGGGRERKAIEKQGGRGEACEQRTDTPHTPPKKTPIPVPKGQPSPCSPSAPNAALSQPEQKKHSVQLGRWSSPLPAPWGAEVWEGTIWGVPVSAACSCPEEGRSRPPQAGNVLGKGTVGQLSRNQSCWQRAGSGKGRQAASRRTGRQRHAPRVPCPPRVPLGAPAGGPGRALCSAEPLQGVPLCEAGPPSPKAPALLTPAPLPEPAFLPSPPIRGTVMAVTPSVGMVV